MREPGQDHSRLLGLMEETLRICSDLEQFTRENFSLLQGEDDKSIIRMIREREVYISALIQMEYRIDLLFDEVDAYEYGDCLPPEADRLRQSVRTTLHTVSELDLEVMKLISSRLQEYRDATIKARNRKHLSAYIRTGASARRSYNRNCDYLK